MAEQDRSEDCEDQDADNGEDDPSPVPPTIIGWAVRALSLLLIGTLAIYLGYKGLAQSDNPSFEVSPKWEDASVAPEGGYRVPVEILNDSQRAIRQLRMELEQDGGDTREIEVPLIGPGEKVTYMVNLRTRDVSVKSAVLSYEE